MRCVDPGTPVFICRNASAVCSQTRSAVRMVLPHFVTPWVIHWSRHVPATMPLRLPVSSSETRPAPLRIRMGEQAPWAMVNGDMPIARQPPHCALMAAISPLTR